MWQKIKGLKEQHGQIMADMQAILNKSETDKRDLTAEESSKFDELSAAAASKLEEVRRHETLYDLGLAASDRPGLNAFESASSAADSTAVRALRADEKAVDYVSGRLTGAKRLSVGFGDFCRSLILGPKSDEERAVLSEGVDAAGGVTVPEILSAQIIDAMRPRSVVIGAGANVVPLLSSKHSFARIASDPTPSWRAENGAVAESEPTFDAVAFAAKSVGFIVKVSRELFEVSVNINSALLGVFSAVMANALDAAALSGTGAGNQPTGIANTAGVLEVDMGANGAAITTYAPLLDAVEQIQSANGGPVTAAALHPRTLRALAGLVDSTGQPLRKPDTIATLPFAPTTQIGIADTHGTAVNASRIILGNFNDAWFGVRTELQIELLRERYAENLQYAFLVHQRFDFQLAHATSFCQITGITP